MSSVMNNNNDMFGLGMKKAPVAEPPTQPEAKTEPEKAKTNKKEEQ